MWGRPGAASPAVAHPSPLPSTQPLSLSCHLCGGPQPGLPFLCCTLRLLRARPAGTFGSPPAWSDPAPWGLPCMPGGQVWQHGGHASTAWQQPAFLKLGEEVLGLLPADLGTVGWSQALPGASVYHTDKG